MQINKRYKIYKNRTKGFGLIEIMVASAILAVSLLGVAAVLSRSLNITVNSTRREAAVRLISQMQNFLFSLNDSDINLIRFNSIPQSCNACLNSCTSQQFFESMVCSWMNNVSKVLPGAEGSICISGTVLKVQVKWKALSGGDRKTESVDLPTALASKIPVTNKPTTSC